MVYRFTTHTHTHKQNLPHSEAVQTFRETNAVFHASLKILFHNSTAFKVTVFFQRTTSSI
jgi:hypothetical protein